MKLFFSKPVSTPIIHHRLFFGILEVCNQLLSHFISYRHCCLKYTEVSVKKVTYKSISFNNLRSKYSAEEAQSMLEENSDNNKSDEETISNHQTSVSSIFDISSNEEDMHCPSDVSTSFDEDEESPRNNPVQFSKNGKTWIPLLSAKSVLTNPSNTVREKPRVIPTFRHKAASSPYECWKLFFDNSMQKTVQAHATREPKKRNSDFE